MSTPTVGRIVHYNQGGDCVAAIITATNGDQASLTHFARWGVETRPDFIAEGTDPGTWHWPERV